MVDTEMFLCSRKLTEDLRKAETNEAAAVDKRYNDERICEIRTAEAHEQSRYHPDQSMHVTIGRLIQHAHILLLCMRFCFD